jgi:hypothetical protein
MSATAPAARPLKGALVDPGFRHRFRDTQPQLDNYNNFQRTGSVVRFNDNVESIGNVGPILPPPPSNENLGPSHLPHSTASDPIDNDEAQLSPPRRFGGLPRTKSQLSMDIKHRRSDTGSLELGPSANNDRSKGKEKANTKEEELLNMGRQDGVTKAGGVRVRPEQRVSDIEDPDPVEMPHQSGW